MHIHSGKNRRIYMKLLAEDKDFYYEMRQYERPRKNVLFL